MKRRLESVGGCVCGCEVALGRLLLLLETWGVLVATSHSLLPVCPVVSVAWNPQAPHILGTATQSGSCLVWDLRTNRPYTHLKDQFRAPFSAISWNPVDSVYLVTGAL